MTVDWLVTILCIFFCGLIIGVFGALIGVSSAFLTRLLRASLPTSWNERKPLGCNLCMSFHLSLLLSGSLYYYGGWKVVFLVLPASLISLVILELGETLIPRVELHFPNEPPRELPQSPR